MNEALSPLAREGLMGSLLVVALVTIIFLFRKFIAEKDARIAEKEARISDSQRMLQVFFDHVAAIKTIREDAERDREDARRKAEIRAIQEEAARERDQPPMRERIPTGQHRPLGGRGRDGE